MPPLEIAILAFPGVQLLDVTGPLQVFASANDLAGMAGRPAPYRPLVVAEHAPVICSAGLGLAAAPLPAAGGVDTVVVAGGRGIDAASHDPVLLRWMRAQAASCRRVASVCSGAFLLAELGLLDGRRATTHWRRVAEFRERFPAVRLEADPIFVRDGHIWTSAGITAGIDLALALVEQDLGSSAALAVARQLVVFLKRPGGQAQFSTALAMQSGDDRIQLLHGWIADHLDADLSLPALAAVAGMSERSLIRHHKRATGLSPARAVERIRVEAARRMLEEGKPVKRVARRCGFGSEETLRRSFLRSVGVTPQAYGERFAIGRDAI
ncbi:MAG: GlxA family transcriptional regulator [Bacteroidota bacterium]